MDCSIPGPSVLHYFLEFAQIHVLCQWYYLTILSSTALFSFWLQSFPASGYFPMSQLFPSGGQCVGASTSASVLPMNVQDWFPLGLTGLISRLTKGLSRIFSSTTVGSINSYSRDGEQRRQWHPTPVFLPGKSCGWRSLVGCSPWGL